MANRLTDKDVSDFVRHNQMVDYIEYVETCISEDTMPVAFSDWLDNK